MPLLPSRSFTHRPRVPLALVPTVENPIGVNVNLLLPPERLALALSKMEECMVLSRSTVLTPFFVITAIQRLPSDAAQLTPSELGQTALLARLLMAAERAVCSRATISLADEASRLPRIRFAKRSEEHTSELQSLMRISYAVFCLKKKTKQHTQTTT